MTGHGVGEVGERITHEPGVVLFGELVGVRLGDAGLIGADQRGGRVSTGG